MLFFYLVVCVFILVYNILMVVFIVFLFVCCNIGCNSCFVNCFCVFFFVIVSVYIVYRCIIIYLDLENYWWVVIYIFVVRCCLWVYVLYFEWGMYFVFCNVIVISVCIICNCWVIYLDLMFIFFDRVIEWCC